MSSVSGLPRCSDDGILKRAKTAAFGTAGVSISAKNGRIYKLTVNNSAATRYYVQIHDKATAPTAGNVPIWEDSLPASGTVVLTFEMGLYVALGFGLAISTTPLLLTFAAATDATASAQYTVVT